MLSVVNHFHLHYIIMWDFEMVMMVETPWAGRYEAGNGGPCSLTFEYAFVILINFFLGMGVKPFNSGNFYPA